MKKMRIRIGTEGKVRVTVEGVCGPGCIDFTRAFEEAIGLVEKRELTGDYHEEVPETVKEKVEEGI